MRDVARAWPDFAHTDLLAARKLLDTEGLTGIACFHAQQCVEKALKAVLEANNQRVPRIHDILTLGRRVEELLPVRFDDRVFDDLNALYVESRYPGEFGLLPSGIPTFDDAVRFADFAERVYDEIRRLLQDVD